MAKSGIHIKPSKRGTFTAAAKSRGKSVQGFASAVLANKDNYSPAMVKKANFARNAAKWKKEFGGYLDTQLGAELIDTPLQQFQEGGRLPKGLPEGTEIRDGNFFNPEGDTIYQHIPSIVGEPSRFVGSPTSAFRPERLEGILGQTRNQNIRSGLIERAPAQPPLRQDYRIAGNAPPVDTVGQYIPEFAGGGVLPEFAEGGQVDPSGATKAAGILDMAGSAVSAIPVIGTIASGVLKIGGAVAGMFGAKKDKQNQLDFEEEQRVQAEKDARGEEFAANQVDYGPTFALGGDLLNPQQGDINNPVINTYSGKANSHQTPTGGIPVDARGNPSAVSNESAVGLTEAGEVAWNGYVFSDKLKS